MLSGAMFVLAMLFSAVAVYFGLATITNPYSDITRVWTTLFFIGSIVSAIVFWVLFGISRDRVLHRDDAGDGTDSSR